MCRPELFQVWLQLIFSRGQLDRSDASCGHLSNGFSHLPNADRRLSLSARKDTQLPHDGSARMRTWLCADHRHCAQFCKQPSSRSYRPRHYGDCGCKVFDFTHGANFDRISRYSPERTVVMLARRDWVLKIKHGQLFARSWQMESSSESNRAPILLFHDSLGRPGSSPGSHCRHAQETPRSRITRSFGAALHK